MARTTKLAEREIEALNRAIPGMANFGEYMRWRESGRLLTEDRYVDPAAASTTNVLAATALTVPAQPGVTAGITQPKHPRVLKVTASQAGQTGVTTINGKDAAGATISDSITSSGATTVNGTKAFAQITSIDLPARNGASDTIAVGLHTAIGFRNKLEHNTVFKTTVDDVVDTAPTVTVSKTVLSGNYFVPNTAANAARDYVIYYIPYPSSANKAV